MNCATEPCAPFFTPDATSTSKLREQLQSVLSGVRSCKFALDAKIEVDRSRLGEATIAIQGKTLPLVPDLKDTTTAGWKMTEANEIEIHDGASYFSSMVPRVPPGGSDQVLWLQLPKSGPMGAGQ
jgi:hypothetical protein